MSAEGARNTGLHVTGGTVSVGGNVNAVQHQHHHAAARESLAAADRRAQRPTDIGILTVLAEEMAAVVEMLGRAAGHRVEQTYGGRTVHRATLAADGGPVRVVAAQALEPGTHSAASAYQELRRRFAPPLVLLVGIAGGVRADVPVGDVVLADEVIWYDSRRETEDGPRRRGRIQATAPVLRHRINDFLVRHGSVVRPGPDGAFRVHRGPIGSGNAVVTDAGSGIRSWLAEVHEKTLAVETEAAGVAQAFYEEIADDHALRGWMTVRGISDRADRHKGHADHELAARHAALVVERLLPYLRLVEEDR
ncbi:5'-methylthioadenosine/S-adenosylhomocysteine nucleosidase family protein [Micromonospora carbonacea]|uniref:Adenosylhomocysteine nucleosidase n=1 Tax=Micromonospora carbonacea TaxID=47853 RepID=A0A1C5A555_9ACTN|nr:5'-methylthioadenosine/S-adenosylhomocysteine nucleosidase [Micromonospora carbonacea]SCF40164.1 adenosylhomocysteine nucleosidase [Micromonospora carbonacea]